MASLDTLPADQRAVLDLVLRRGRSYDEIAGLLAIDRAGVRARALAAFDGLGPDTGLAPEARALITDYLLGQLPPRVAEQTRDRLATSPDERAWARVLASELEPVSSKPLPEIPDGTARSKAATDKPAPANRAAAAIDEPAPATEPAPPDRTAPATDDPGRAATPRRLPRPGDRPTSRLGGAIFLLVGAIVVVVVVVVLVVVLSSGGSNTPTTAADTGTTAPATTGTTAPSTTGTTAPSTTGTTGSPTTTTTGTTGTTSAKIVGQVNLDPPSGTGSAKGAAFVVKAGTAYGIIVEAQGLAPNSHNAYAVWLSNTPADSVRVGFVNTPVGKNGRLETDGALPTNAAHYKDLLLTLETSASPKTPGQTILQGALTGIS